MKMKFFENNGITVLLEYVQRKYESMMFPYICAMSYVVFPSGLQKLRR
jgi:hypothetical protein